LVISEETRAAIAERIGLFPQARGALLPALHLVQKEHGHVSRECAEELAEIFEIRAIEVQEVITFYNMFYSTP
jgi:NADH:ubiquinone oxidoreductase subunit E